jgi:hypothetical protein
MKGTLILAGIILAGGIYLVTRLQVGWKAGDVIQVYKTGEGWVVYTILEERPSEFLLGKGYPSSTSDLIWVSKEDFALMQIRRVNYNDPPL